MLDVFIDDLHFSLSPLEDRSLHMGITVNMDPNLIMFLGVDQGRNIENLIPHLSLFGLEEAVEFKETHHLAGAIVELNKNDALIFQ